MGSGDDGAVKRIWFIRHAESEAQAGLSEDYVNSPLSERGREQAWALAGPLSGATFDCIVVSPLARAWQTFELSRARARRAVFDSRAAEHFTDPSHYRAILPVETPPIAEPDPHDAWLRDPRQRMTDLLDDLLARPERSIVVFAHWGLFNHLLPMYLGMDCYAGAARAFMDNTGVSLLEVGEEGRRTVRYWNRRAREEDFAAPEDG